MAVAPDFATLVVLRALTGLALAAVVGVAMGHVGAEVHPGGLGSAMGLYVAGNSLGGVGGRLVTAGVSDGSLVALGRGGARRRWAPWSPWPFWRLLPHPVADDAAGRPAAERPRGRGGAGRCVAGWRSLALVVVPFTLMGGFVAVYNYLGYRLSGRPLRPAAGPAGPGLPGLPRRDGRLGRRRPGRRPRWAGRRVLVASVLVMGAGARR